MTGKKKKIGTLALNAAWLLVTHFTLRVCTIIVVVSINIVLVVVVVVTIIVANCHSLAGRPSLLVTTCVCDVFICVYVSLSFFPSFFLSTQSEHHPLPIGTIAHIFIFFGSPLPFFAISLLVAVPLLL